MTTKVILDSKFRRNPWPHGHLVSPSIILIGLTAMASQIVFMREFLIIFYGNELSISFILANWLIGGAIGSWILGRSADSIEYKVQAFTFCQMALSVLLPLNILLIRSVKSFLGISAGEILGFPPVLMSTFVILVPTCAILGFTFSLACRIYEIDTQAGAVRIGRVYVLEAIGAMVGGLLASFVLIRFFDSMRIMAIFSLFNLFAALSLHLFHGKFRLRRLFTIAVGAMLILNSSAWFFNGWAKLNQYSLKRQWVGYDLLASRNSIYGNVAATKLTSQISFFDNGLHLYTVPDTQSSEEAVHYALLEHRDPRAVLLIGGGLGGAVAEILKHPVVRLDYVELDPLIIKMAEEYLPDEYYGSLKDARVSIKNEDGRFFVKTAADKYDCVIINLGNPYTAQLNRYYTAEFFKEAKSILNPEGIISFAVGSSESYINKELGELLRSFYATLKTVFNDVKVIPGETAYFLAADGSGLLTYDYNTLVERIEARNLDLKYVREYYLFSKLSPQKVSYTEDVLGRRGAVKINYDFRPISYYYDIIYWTSRFRDSLFSKALKFATPGRLWKAIGALCVFILLIALGRARRGKFFKKAILMTVAVIGFNGIAFQIITMLSFQIIYGYLFYKLGLMLTYFMIGLSLGGWWVTKIMPSLKKGLPLFMWTQGAACLYFLALPMVLWRLSALKLSAAYWFGSNICFPLLSVIAGIIGGIQFPLANKLYLEREEELGRVAALNYGMDLIGSCLGALFTGAFLIPVLGVPQACLGIAAINITVAIMLGIKN